MGDSDFWLQRRPLPTFEELFDNSKGREDALEAVQLLKKPDIDREHVRKILWRARRERDLTRLWRDQRRKAEKVANALRVVNTAFDPPPVASLEQEFLRTRPRSRTTNGGRPVLPFYAVAMHDLTEIGVRQDLAKVMLRGLGLQYGPPPQG